MRLIPTTIKLGFDPDTVIDPELQAVIGDDLAWAIWLTWKPCHIVSDSFNKACLTIADRIRRRQPTNMREWARCFVQTDHNFSWGDVDEWISQAYPFLTGAAKIYIEVCFAQ